VRERKREKVGRVVSDRMDKTVMVAVQMLRQHRLYQRTMRQTKKYMAHDETNTCRVGDLVRLQESRPISRHKHWRVVQVLEEAARRGKAVGLPEVARVAAATDAQVVAGANLAPEPLFPATAADGGAGGSDAARGGRRER
jgi:small subunit ribosomal protein S17